MPVTITLSRQFYEKLGDEVTNELADWLNHVDLAYRTELRELNETNFARSDAKVEQRFAEFELRLERRLVEFETTMNRRLGEIDSKIDRRSVELEAKLETGLAQIRSEMAAFKAELIKWMFLFWLGTVATTLAISQALR